MFGPYILLAALAVSAYFLWADRNGRRVHKD